MTVEHLTPENWAETAEGLHLTPVVKVGNTVHTSGSTGRSDDPDPEAQLVAAFEDVGELLASAGASWADVVKMTTYHVGGFEAHLDLLLDVRDRYVTEPYPAWTAVGVTDLSNPHALIEIDVIAAI